MKTQTEPIDFQQDIMVNIQLFDGRYEINQELIPVVQQAAQALGISDIENLVDIPEETFFAVFTPMMNNHYGLEG
jgi:hypothetical protein